MTNKKNIMSLSGVNPELQQRLREIADKKGISVSRMIRDLIETHFEKDGEKDTVVLRIPTELRYDKEKLENWLDIRTKAIVKSLSS